MSEAIVDLYIIRHAESEKNLVPDEICGRSNDIALSEEGVGQARQLGRDLLMAGIKPNFVCSSPAIRALQTAQLSLLTMGCCIMPARDDRLQEMSQGLWEGRLRQEIYTPEVLARIATEPLTHKAPEGESIQEVAARMRQFIGSIALRRLLSEKSQTVFAYGHGYSTRIAAGSILGWSTEKMRTTVTPNVSLSRLRYDGDWSVQYVGQPAATLLH